MNTTAATFATLLDADEWARGEVERGGAYNRARGIVTRAGRTVKVFTGPHARQKALGYPSEWDRRDASVPSLDAVWRRFDAWWQA